ncbi:protein of unknown function [Candidatus Promineifilum breve]|uniref:Uncharacterized protein n=1 Tax=Candidatus Promineifilum breve TaxID=1806508 RepID=A0A160T3I5_9CHLR|nr:protein of unknown function [Candidatus Promineifilum breve]
MTSVGPSSSPVRSGRSSFSSKAGLILYPISCLNESIWQEHQLYKLTLLHYSTRVLLGDSRRVSFLLGLTPFLALKPIE